MDRDNNRDLNRDYKSLKKTVKEFDTIVSRISPDSKPSRSVRLLKRIVMSAFGGLVLLMILVPPFRYPVDGPVTSAFFFRRPPDRQTTGFLSFDPSFDIEAHRGIDLAAPEGTRVVSSVPGIVAETGYSNSYGNYVRIVHLFGFHTFYAHLSEIDVKRGTLIIFRTLRAVGKVGTTGRSTGPHLHFEIRLFGKALPPRFLMLFHGIRRMILDN